ncbi:hypothetical protein JCM8097_000695 [Rhodosporidiobolus ruineniae]
MSSDYGDDDLLGGLDEHALQALELTAVLPHSASASGSPSLHTLSTPLPSTAAAQHASQAPPHHSASGIDAPLSRHIALADTPLSRSYARDDDQDLDNAVIQKKRGPKPQYGPRNKPNPVGRPPDPPEVREQKRLEKQAKKAELDRQVAAEKARMDEEDERRRAETRRKREEEVQRLYELDPQKHATLASMKLDSSSKAKPSHQASLSTFFTPSSTAAAASPAAGTSPAPRASTPASFSSASTTRTTSRRTPTSLFAHSATPDALNPLNPVEQSRTGNPLRPLVSDSAGSTASGVAGTVGVDEEMFGGEGVGEPEPGEADEGRQDRDEEDEAPSAPHRQPQPAYVQEDYRRAKEWIAASRDAQGLTACDRPLKDDANPKKRGIGSPFLPFATISSHFYNARIPDPVDLCRRQFVYYDPFALIDKGAACPGCGKEKMARHGFPPRPRRVADLEDTVYLFGQRYLCNKTKAGGCGRTFMSTHPLLLAQLPSYIRSSFPFHLTHRAAVTAVLFNQYRSAVQHGVGPVTFASMLSRAHRRRYDEKRRAYFQAIADRHYSKHAPPLDEQNVPRYTAFPDFDDPQGYAAYSPSAKWLNTAFNQFTELHESEIKQHTSLLTCEIAAIDHSHNIVKYIVRVDGEPVFTGLLTITNEYGEIKQCSLVPTKAHDQFVPAVESMRHHLVQYGHNEPFILYTDNPRGDAAALRAALPSLLRGVAPSLDSSLYAHLPPFPPVEPAKIVVLETLERAHRTIGLVLEEAQGTTIGFDIEWNVREDARGGMQREGGTAVVQLAVGDTVYLVQLARIRRLSSSLPRSLLDLILSSSIRKAGVGVTSDLSLVLNDYRSASSVSIRFGAAPAGALDLAVLARKKALPLKNFTLASLTASLFGQNLRKPADLRVSSMWESNELSLEQQQYAAADAVASLRVAEKLATLPLGRGAQLSPEEAVPGAAVLAVQADETAFLAEAIIVASGKSAAAASPLPADFDASLHPNLTPSRTLLRVSNVLIPSAVLSTYKGKYNQPPSLSSLSAVSPYLVLPTRQLRAAGPADLAGSASSAAGLTEGGSGGSGLGVFGSGSAEDGEGDEGLGEEEEEEGEEGEEEDLFGAVEDDVTAEDVSGTSEDPKARELGWKLLQPLLDRLASLLPSDLPFTRVLLDAWHAMDRIKVPKRHGCHAEYYRALSAAIFVPDPKDKALLSARFARLGSSFDYEVRRRPEYVWARCRRTIPPPHELVPAMASVFLTYGPLIDAKTGAPLFNPAAWRSAARLLEDAAAGFLSDVPGVELYSLVRECRGEDGKLRDGVQIYRCSRGTNATEGGVHRNLKVLFANSTVSLRFARNRLLTYQLVHNLLVGTFNRTGQRYSSHFDIWLIDEIQSLSNLVAPLMPGAPVYGNWINGGMYTQTTETYAILPITASTAADLSISLHPSHPSYSAPSPASSPPFNEPPPPKKSKRHAIQRHPHLAAAQGTRFPILHIHTKAERALFSELEKDKMLEHVKGKEARAKAFARRFNLAADGAEIFYKTPTHIHHYYSKLETAINRTGSLLRSQPTRDKLEEENRSPKRAAKLSTPS